MGVLVIGVPYFMNRKCVGKEFENERKNMTKTRLNQGSQIKAGIVEFAQELKNSVLGYLDRWDKGYPLIMWVDMVAIDDVDWFPRK